MTESICNLYNELLELAAAQKDAVLKGRYEDAEKFCQRRQGIIDKIQHINSKEPSSHQEELSNKIPVIINKILSIDNDMKTIIQKKMKSLGKRLEDVQKVKAFYHSVIPRRAKGQVNINV